MKKETRDLLLAGSISVTGGILVSALIFDAARVNNTEELTYLRNYTRLDRALDKMISEDEDLTLLYHDLVRIDNNQWLWTYSIYDTYLEETQSVRMAFNNDITKCIWADYVDDDEYVKCDPKEDIDMKELWSYME